MVLGGSLYVPCAEGKHKHSLECFHKERECSERSGVKVSKVGESYAAMVKKNPLEVGEVWIEIGGMDALSKMHLASLLVGRWDNFLDQTLSLSSLKKWLCLTGGCKETPIKHC
ncbi:hypothetical protein CK203_011963 [Vitis vinifera]|uniref:Uncharacterized protein n=1 Tax=Vitis vinifera TaxID=29760 RepID=A0A438K0E7_VITVI|nr:hypothetical protein CK203_011963 [Vitis vinifera]